MKKTLFLGTALMIGAAGFAQSGAKKAKDINPKYLQKAVSQVKITAESKPTPGGTRVTPTIAKLRPNAVQGGTTPCGLQEFTTSWNAFGVGGGSTTSAQNCLTYNKDLNTLVWTQRGSKTWSLNTISGNYQATTINATTLALDSVIMYVGTNNPGRYPSGTIVNPVGNTNILNAYAVSFGPALDAGGTNWVGTAYTTKSFGAASAIGHTAPAVGDKYEDSGTGQIFGNCIGSDLLGSPSQDLAYLPDGQSFVTVGAIQNANVTAADANGNMGAVRGAIFVKGVITSTTTLTVDTLSMKPDVYFGTLAYALGEPRMAFGPDGQTGYVVMLGRMAQTYGNSSDSTMTPIVYKTTDGGTTWALQTNLLGYDWACRHPEVMQGVNSLFPEARCYSFTESFQGADVAVDANNKLHFVTTVVEPFGWSDATSSPGHGNPDSMAIYSYSYHYDFVNNHPIIWDFMTDGSDWNTMLVDSIISSDISSSSADTTNASTPWGGTTTLGVNAHIQVSRSLDGTKIFYGWADSDPNVVVPNIYGQVLNTNPDIMMKAWDLTTNMVSATKNTTSSNPYTGACFYPYLSDISYNNGTDWVVPAVFTVGHNILTSTPYNVYDASAQADYHYSNCGTFSAAELVNTPSVYTSATTCAVGISKNKTFDASVTSYPNPFSSTTTIAVNLSEAKTFSINIYNTIGALVYNKTVSGNVGTNNVTFDGSALNAGVYYYTVNTGNQQATKKMVIAK